jgi:hypothetical protein
MLLVSAFYFRVVVGWRGYQHSKGDRGIEVTEGVRDYLSMSSVITHPEPAATANIPTVRILLSTIGIL